MKIYSNRADKNVDCIRTSMRTEKHNSLHVTLNFRRTVGGPVTMEEETGSEVRINFTDTCELDNFIMALTQLNMICESFNWSLDEIMQMNIEKLEKRYPDGFDVIKANNRSPEDV